MSKKDKENKPILKRKSGFYQQYKLEQKPSITGRAFIDLGDEKWKVIRRLLNRIAKISYHVLVFFLSSVGITALLNAPIRKILIDSLFG